MSEWHVIMTKNGRWKSLNDNLGHLSDVDNVCAPSRREVVVQRGVKVEREYPWLGPLVLARWATDDPHVWHDVNDLPDVAGILGGWPPAAVSDRSVQVMLNRIQVLESKEQVIGPAPCQPGDIVRFTHLAFWRIVARCVWVDQVGMIGVRVGILGHDHIISVPWAAVDGRMEGITAPQYRAKKRFTSASV